MRARLVYDGDCGFCRYTVAYAEALTGTRVEYRPYQEVASEHPDVTEADFQAAIQLFRDDERLSAAQAAFTVLAIGGRGAWLWAYRHAPGAATLFEWLYRLVAKHRRLCLRLARLLFGPKLLPRHHARTAAWLHRAIALCALCAFLSFWWQLPGLIGSDGILPAADYLDSVAAVYDWQRFILLPTVLWLNTSDVALHALCAIGSLAMLVAAAGRCRAICAALGYVCYLSLLHAGQTFTGYQWDTLLTECLLLSVLLARAPTLGIWLARLLLLRFMLLAGAAKLLSGDPTWASGTALYYHFETQPLPTPLAWYAHQLPPLLLRWGTWTALLIELVLPWFAILSRNPRRVAAAGFVLLEVLIALTGNYNFFNLLTLALCIALFDDGQAQPVASADRQPQRSWLLPALAVLIAAQGLSVVATSLTRTPLPQPQRWLAPFMVANPYGLFAVMTTSRDELSVEASVDGQSWMPYRFHFKPGPVAAAPRFCAPHQPRLDWQLWFAALGPPEQAPWVYDFVQALLEEREPVLRLLDGGGTPTTPRFVRIQRHAYRFATPDERRATGDWWVRGPARDWLPPVRLRTPRIRHEPLTLDPSD